MKQTAQDVDLSKVSDAVKRRIQKAKGSVTKAEVEIASCLQEIQDNPSSEIGAELKDATISCATEIEVEKTGKKCLVVTVPYRQYQNSIRRMQGRLISELEKKTKKHVVIFPRRTILNSRNFRQRGFRVLPRKCTLTKVQEDLLEDLVYPVDIVGKRLRVRTDGSKLQKIHLDPKDKNKENIEEKLETFSEVYRRLTHKNVEFLFPDI